MDIYENAIKEFLASGEPAIQVTFTGPFEGVSHLRVRVGLGKAAPADVKVVKYDDKVFLIKLDKVQLSKVEKPLPKPQSDLPFNNVSLRTWIAKNCTVVVDVEEIEIVGIKADGSRAWSEATFEGFSCHIEWMHLPSGTINKMYMGEDDVVEFLNWMWSGDTRR